MESKISTGSQGFRLMKKRGRKVGYRKPDPRKKGSITLPADWWKILRSWKALYGYSQSQSIHRALEDLKMKIDSEE